MTIEENKGVDHKDTLDAMNQLADKYIYFEEYPEAEQLLSVLFQRSIKINGQEDEQTLQIMSKLATSRSRIKRDNDALELLKELCLLRENNNPNRYDKNATRTLAILTKTYNKLKSVGAKDKMVIRVETIIYEIKGSTTPNEFTETILDRMEKLAVNLIGKSKDFNALAAFIYDAITTNKMKNSKDKKFDVFIFSMINKSAKLFESCELYDLAVKGLEQLLELRLDSFGPQNLKVLQTIIDLMQLYYKLKKYNEAISLIDRFDNHEDEKLKNIKHIDGYLIKIKSLFAKTYELQGNYTTAKKYLQECIKEKYHEENNMKFPKITTLMLQLGTILLKLEEYNEAENLLQKCYLVNLIQIGANMKSTEEAVNALLDCYRIQGKDEQVEFVKTQYENTKTVLKRTSRYILLTIRYFYAAVSFALML